MEKRKLVIVGASGFGREVLWQLEDINKEIKEYDILGFVDDAPELLGKVINSYTVIGNMEWLINYPEEICAVICIGNSKIRRQVYNRLAQNKNICFPSIIAKDVQCSEYVKLGKGCVVCLSTVLTTNIEVGDFCVINLDCTIGHDAILGDFVTLYPSVNVSGNVHIGNNSEIGTGSNLIQGKSVGNNTIVGAGSVVIRDIPANCTAVGVPAMPIKFLDEKGLEI